MEHKYSYKTCDRCGRKITDKWYEYKKPCVISYEYANKEEGYIEEKRLIDLHVKKAKKDIKKIRKLESFNISFYNSREDALADLCGECMKQFRKFMKNEV